VERANHPFRKDNDALTPWCETPLLGEIDHLKWEVSTMAEDKEKNSGAACEKKCDVDFVSCVESWKQDCLDRFRSCASACRI